MLSAASPHSHVVFPLKYPHFFCDQEGGNEEQIRKKRIMIFNLKNKTGKSDVECVNDVFGKMGAGQSCDDVVDVVRLRQKENGPIIKPMKMAMSEVWSQEPCLLIYQPPTTQSATSYY